MKVQFHESAVLDFEDSVAFYRFEASAVVALAFTNEVERVLDLLCTNHLLGKAVTASTSARQFALDRFPYSVVYVQSKGQLVVLAIAHHSRRPNYWQGRWVKTSPAQP